MSVPRPNYENNFSSQGLPSYPPHQHEPDYKAPFDDLLEHYDDDAQHFGRPTYAKQFYSSSSLDLEATPSQRPATTYLTTKETRGIWERVLPDSVACRLFVLTVIVETIVDLVIEGMLLIRFNSIPGVEESNLTSRMPVYLAVFALAHVFQLGLAIDAVYARNTLQFVFLIMFNALFLIYSIVQISEVKMASTAIPALSASSALNINILITTIPIVISVAEIAYMALGWKIYSEFGWKVYKFLGADRRIKKMYAMLQVFLCLVKFDLFFWIGFSVQFIWLVLDQDKDAEYYITYAALPLSILLLVEGHLAARHENKWMMAAFMSGCVGAMVYFVYKLYKVLRFKNEQEFALIWPSLTIFSVLAILLLLATFISACVVLGNFGHGLKTQLEKSVHPGLGRRGTERRPANSQFPLSSNPHRMSIE